MVISQYYLEILIFYKFNFLICKVASFISLPKQDLYQKIQKVNIPLYYECLNFFII